MDNNTLRIGIGIESIALVQKTDHPFRSNKINKYNGEKSIVFGLSACRNDNDNENDLVVLMLFLCIGIESIALVEQTEQHYIRNKLNKYNGLKSVVFRLSACWNDNDNENGVVVLLFL